MVKMLIIEDEPQLLQNLASFLDSFGDEFEVLTASSGEDGMGILENEEGINLVLTDVRLPGIDGIEIVGRVSQLYPEMTIVVMTAFGSAELRTAALQEGALKYIEKPIDLDELAVTLHDAHERPRGRSKSVAGLDILDVAQFISISGESKVIQFRTEAGQGKLAFDQGVMTHCSTADCQGTDAFFTMSLWGEGTFWEVFDADLKSFPENLNIPTRELLEEAISLLGEIESPTQPFAVSAALAAVGNKENGHTSNSNKENTIMAIKDHLTDFESIEGFQGAAVFTAQGEMLDGIAKGKLDIKTIGMFANNALLNSQKATDQMGVGRGNLMQIRAPQAVVMMRCLNEATDFAASKEGKVHFHTVVVMDPEGNTAMASMILDKCVGKIVEELR